VDGALLFELLLLLLLLLDDDELGADLVSDPQPARARPNATTAMAVPPVFTGEGMESPVVGSSMSLRSANRIRT
jgi:hypothetical protein